MTLPEAVAFLAILGLIMGIGALYLRPLASPVNTSLDLTQSFLHQARSTALVSTSAVRVRAINNYQLITETAPYCSSSVWREDPSLSLDLPRGITLTDLSWDVCFSSRGISSSNVIVELEHEHRGRKQIEVLWGGATRVLP